MSSTARPQPLLVGGIAFAIAAVLVLTIGGLILGFSGRPDPSPTASPTSPSASPSSSAPPPTTGEVTALYCYLRNDSNPKVSQSGTLSSQDSTATVPSDWGGAFDGSLMRPRGPFMGSISYRAGYGKHKQWPSFVQLGQTAWQPGIDYPGDEQAAERMVDCMIASSLPLDDYARGHSVTDRATEPVSLNGADGFRSTATIELTDSDTGDPVTLTVVSTVLKGSKKSYTLLTVANTADKDSVAAMEQAQKTFTAK